jgi:hypothetical protein
LLRVSNNSRPPCRCITGSASTSARNVIAVNPIEHRPDVLIKITDIRKRRLPGGAPFRVQRSLGCFTRFDLSQKEASRDCGIQAVLGPSTRHALDDRSFA